jgi:hypothetical protein
MNGYNQISYMNGLVNYTMRNIRTLQEKLKDNLPKMNNIKCTLKVPFNKLAEEIRKSC